MNTIASTGCRQMTKKSVDIEMTAFSAKIGFFSYNQQPGPLRPDMFEFLDKPDFDYDDIHQTDIEAESENDALGHYQRC